MIAEFIFIFAMALTVVLSISILYFLLVFESIFQEEVYENSYKAFMLLIIAVIFHGVHHADFIFGRGNIIILSEALSMITFLTGVALMTKYALRANVSIGVNKRLAEELDKRTAELRERTIELEGSNRFKQLLIDILGHDLLNLVGVTKSASEILLEEREDDTLKVIKDSSEKLIDIIENTASLARLENVQMLEFADSDIGLMLDDVIESFKPTATEKNISMAFEGGKSYPAKANQLVEEVFNNLISNAIKYTNVNGKVIVEVLDAGGYWKVMVEDNGIGIADEYKGRIFQRFERIKKEGVKGTGLGLAIAKRIIDLHGGEIWVEDNPEGGSIFNVTLPKA
ncbi:MAG: sensor histidine kinase [Candidatus Hydrothermarchaeaceae archaeon]